MGLKKIQKQGRNERMQEDYLTSTKIHCRCRVVFLHSSSLPCFCTFSGPSLDNKNFSKNFFLIWDF